MIAVSLVKHQRYILQNVFVFKSFLEDLDRPSLLMKMTPHVRRRPLKIVMSEIDPQSSCRADGIRKLSFRDVSEVMMSRRFEVKDDVDVFLYN